MSEQISFQVDPTILAALSDHNISSLEEEVVRQEPRLELEVNLPSGGGTRDLATIITATAALAPMVVPIALRLIDRLFGCAKHEETTEVLADGSVKREVRITPC
jgi:hypothetical protein